MLRICIPVHNEATTIGVLLWRLRSVFQGFSREYDVVVYDDASTDGTGEVLEPYQSVMPLTIIRGGTHRGYAASIDALVRHVAADDEYARRDAMVLLQGDFTESPEHLPELVKRFEGGADLVAVHRTTSDATPADERRLRRWGRWAVKPFLRMPPVADPFTGFRLVRIAVLRDLLRALGSRPVCAGDGWAANIDFALNVAPFARRIENVEFAPRYDVRQRASRRRGWADVVALFHWARAARGTPRPVPGSKAPADSAPRERQAEVSVGPTLADRPARPPQERDRSGRPERGGRPGRDDRAAKEERAQRDERPGQREERAARPPRDERPPREERPAREERAPRAERPPREPRPPREERAPRAERPPRPDRRPAAETASGDAAAPLDAEPREHILPSTTPEMDAVMESAADLTAGESDGTMPPGEKRSRRRRRRSRRDRGARGEAGSATGDEAGDDDGELTDAPAESPRFRQAPGTTDAGEGEQDDGDDDGDGAPADGDSGAEGTGASRRKRRPRRRRRGRRPGAGGDAAGAEGPPPSAAEPPTD